MFIFYFAPFVIIALSSESERIVDLSTQATGAGELRQQSFQKVATKMIDSFGPLM